MKTGIFGSGDVAKSMATAAREGMKVCVTRRYRASPERVFDAWLDPETAGKWLFATASRPLASVTIDARPGGSFHLQEKPRVAHTGTYLEIARPRRLSFTLSMRNGRRADTRVVAEIVPLRTGCELTLTHRNVPPDDATRTEGRWTGILYGLSETLKTG